MKSSVTRTAINFAGDLAQKIDDFRFENRIPTQSRAVRMLLEKGLEVVAQQGKGKENDGHHSQQHT